MLESSAEWLRLLIAWGGLLFAGAFIGYIFIVTLAAMLPLRQWRGNSKPSERESFQIAIVIPAHNESLLIRDTVLTAAQQNYPKEQFSIYVVADNCQDDTAQQARDAGATVLERFDNPGKGQALHTMFTQLSDPSTELSGGKTFDAFLVIDADCSLMGDALLAIKEEMLKGSRVIQLLDSISNPDVNNRTMAMQLGMASFNGLRPRGRWNLGVSCGFFGNGFCLSRQVLEEVPYLAHSIVEDLEYHLLVLEKGYKVQLVDQGIAAAQAPLESSDSASQRSRWEVGRALMIRNHAWKLFKKGLTGKAWAWVALMEVIMPPASMIALFALLPLVVGYTEHRIAAIVLISMMAFHYLVSSIYYGSVINFFKICAYLPRYIWWKTKILLMTISKMNAMSWVRTDRHQRQESEPSKTEPSTQSNHEIKQQSSDK